MISKKWVLPLAFLLAQNLLSAQTPSKSEPTFSRDVAPILYRHCVGCHHPDDIAPMSLLTYQEVRPWAAAIRDAVLTRKMPPWKADSKYGQWSNDSRLSDSELAILRAWTEGPKLAGDPKDMPPPPEFNGGWKIGKPDVVFSVPEHKLSASGPDEYTYVNVPTNFTDDRWVVAAELRPGNRRIVHHAHVFVKEESTEKPTAPKDVVAQYDDWLIVHESTLEFLRPDAPVIDNGCARDDNGLLPGSKIANLGNLMCSYLPGRDAELFPPGTARKIPKGAILNFQIHYSRATHKDETDVTSVGFVFAKEPPRQVLHMTSITSQMFLIPPGAPNHEVTECHTFDHDIVLTSLTPHMHLRGKSMRYIAHLPDGQEKTLLYVPAYNFNWQFTYLARNPVFLPKGTRIEVIATFDNSPNNPLNPDPSKIVRWGAASENEMMDGWMEYIDAEQPAASTQAKTNLR